MLKYDLDRLGFYQFEWLAQTLLRARFGFHVEAWGGSGDHGRDAYSAVDVASIIDSTVLPGPVVFQAKFVSGATAAGANFGSLIYGACKAEVKRIMERKLKGKWDELKSYVLVTNCPLLASHREAIGNIFFAELGVRPILVGGLEISADLDYLPSIARSFPQILTFDNLMDILSSTIDSVVHKEIYIRTESLLLKAQKVVPVFVPTAAFDSAWEVLRKHNFAILTGPPEMGKTSTSWMIALAQLAHKWQVVDCASPSDFFKVFDSHSSQIFLADDAFGKTEFNLESGRAWERELESILNRLDARHYFVWTSRKTVLAEARRKIDVLKAPSSPLIPAEVVIQANKLSAREKALMLYRHAANANLEKSAKQLLKQYAYPIVSDDNFTPLRISLFVKKSLPHIAEQSLAGTLRGSAIQAAIASSIRQVTVQMKTTFEALPIEEKWLLITLLSEHLTDVAELARTLSILSPSAPPRPVAEMLRDLDDSFLNIRGGIVA